MASVSASLSVAAAGIRAGALTPGGGAAATVVGTLVLQGFGRNGAGLLGFFFGSGSALSRLPAAQRFERGKVARSERQVLANGGIAALAALGKVSLGHAKANALFAGSLAAATSDTWATEIGLQSGQIPRYILAGTAVPHGFSGGITPAGTIASVAGAFASASLTALLYRRWLLLPVCLAGGLAGSILDSILGELVQRKRRTLDSGEVIESKPDEHSSTVLVSGLNWVDNDLVNLACTATGGVFSFALWALAAQSSSGSTSGAARPVNGPA